MKSQAREAPAMEFGIAYPARPDAWKDLVIAVLLGNDEVLPCVRTSWICDAEFHGRRLPRLRFHPRYRAQLSREAERSALVLHQCRTVSVILTEARNASAGKDLGQLRASEAGTGSEIVKRPYSLQPVVPLRAAGENVGERLRRHAHRPDHPRCIPEAVEMRIVGRPQDVVGAKVVGEHRERLLDRLERDEALTMEHFAGTRLDRHVVHAHVVKMPVHPIEPSRHPSSPRFQEANPEPRETVAHAAHDQTRRRRHHLERMRNAMAHGAALRETLDPDRLLLALRAAMNADRKVELLRLGP